MEPDCLCLDGAHEALGRAVLRRLAHGGPAALDPVGLPPVGIKGGGVLAPLGGVVARGPVLRQSPLQGGSRQQLLHLTAHMPAAAAARLDLQYHRPGDERLR